MAVQPNDLTTKLIEKEVEAISTRELAPPDVILNADGGFGTDRKRRTGTAAFWQNFRTSIVTGFMVTVFFIPVCDTTTSVLLFSTGANMTAPWFGQLSDANTETNHTVSGFNLPDVFSSPDLKTYWPNVIQFMFFSITANFGSSIGAVTEGIYGTVIASVNVMIMSLIFPYGGKCVKQGKAIAFGLRQVCEEYYHPGYGEWGWKLAWADTILLIVLATGSTHSVSVKKFLLSFHTLNMMAYMSYAGWVASNAVMWTTLWGGALALMVMANTPESLRARNWPKDIAKQMEEVTKQSVELMMKPSSTRYKGLPPAMSLMIGQKIDTLNSSFAQMMASLNDAWWECLIYPRRKLTNKRGYYFANVFEFDDVKTSSSGLDDFMYLIRQCVLRRESEVDDQQGDKMLDTITKANLLQPCCDSAMMLMNELANWAADDGYNADNLKTLLDACGKNRKQLVEQYRTAAKDDPKFPGSSLHSFVYALTCIAEKIETTGRIVSEETDFKEKTSKFGVRCTLLNYATKTYSFSVIGDRDYVDRWLRDAFVIGIAFFIGNFFNGSVFTAYSGYMASTLSLLLIPGGSPGSNFYKNVHRLMGVTLGKSLTILLMAIIALAGDTGPVPVFAHLVGIFFFITYFASVYFQNGYWCYVCMLIAGFSCYTLVGEKSSDWWSAGIFVTRYQEIGQFTSAIVFRTIVDAVDTVCRGKLPRDQIVATMQKLGYESGEKGKPGLIPQLLILYFDENIKLRGKDTEHDKAKRKLLSEIKFEADHLHDLLPATESSTILSVGARSPFDANVFAATVECVDRITQEIDMLFAIEAMKGWGSVEFSEIVGTLAHKKKHLQETLKFTFQALQQVFEKSDDAPKKMALESDYEATLQFFKFSNEKGTIRGRVVFQIINNILAECTKAQQTIFSRGLFSLTRLKFGKVPAISN